MSAVHLHEKSEYTFRACGAKPTLPVSDASLCAATWTNRTTGFRRREKRIRIFEFDHQNFSRTEASKTGSVFAVIEAGNEGVRIR
jgi:hypothetical protein